jgi:hypothetical protein
MNGGKGMIDLFHERDGQLTIRKDTNDDVEAATLSPSDQLDTSKAGTADGKTLSRGHLSPACTQQCAPQLLLRQEQQGKKKGRARSSPLRNLAREETHCALTPLGALACVCGHDKSAHARFRKGHQTLTPEHCLIEACRCSCYTPAQIEPPL